jgi:hypothetical protein
VRHSAHPGSSSSVELSGQAKAELAGLLKRVSELGLQGTAKYQQSEFQGLVQKDVATALRDSASCKVRIVEILAPRFIAPPAPNVPSKPRSEDRTTDVVTLSLDCSLGLPPSVMPPEGRIRALMPQPTPPGVVGGFDYIEYFGASGAAWSIAPPGDKHFTSWACEVINDGDVTIFDVSFLFDVSFQEVVKRAPNTLESGKTTSTHLSPITILRLAPRVPFRFHVLNAVVPQWINLTPREYASFRLGNESTARTTRLHTRPYYGWLIMLNPIDATAAEAPPSASNPR